MSDRLKTMATVGETDSRIFDLTLQLRRVPGRIAEAKRQLDAEQVVLD